MTDLTHKETLEAFETNWRADQDNREDALEDLRFLAGDQWSDKVRAAREADGRPVLTIPRLGQFVQRVVGGIRQSHPAIEAIASDDQSDQGLADIMEGMIRQIEYSSNASAAYAWAAQCAVACGIGHIRFETCYADDGSFNQVIKIKRVMDPNSVVWEAGAVELDRSDAWECYVTEMVAEAEYKRRWPKEKNDTPSNFPVPDSTVNHGLLWRADKRIRVASRWFKTAVKRKIGMTQDGQVFDITKVPREIVQMLGVVQERQVDDHKVQHVVLSGDDFLTDVQEWAGRYIPIVPMIGNEVAFDGKVIRHGIVRPAKDAQRMYNYARSAAVEGIGSAPKAPWLVPVGSIDGHEDQWAKANTGNPPYLFYNVNTENPTLRPERMPPPAMQTAWVQEAEIAGDDMKATTGIYDAALGNRSNETSGVAIEQRQQETDTGSFVYVDNFNGMIKRGGVILIDLIPKTYDGEQVVRVLGKAGEEGFVPINRQVGQYMINDLSTGSFDVRIKTGPSYANAKQQAKDALDNLMKSDPAMMQAFGDIYFGSLDVPGDLGKKLVDRATKLLAPGLVPPEEGGQAPPQPPPPDPAQQGMVEAALRTSLAKAILTEAQADGQVLANETAAEALGLHPGAEAPREMNPVVPGQGGQRQAQPAG